jgi:DNA polymerase III delta' subunit
MKTLLHPRARTGFTAMIARGTESYIVSGPRSIGKATAAREVVVQLNCLDGQPGGSCTHCRQLAAGNFPDLIWISRGDKASLSIEQMRGLTAQLSLQPYEAHATRVVVIEDAHTLTVEAQNALLKLLEEPPPGTLILLLAERIDSLLITVRSRCQSLIMSPLERTDLSSWLVSTHGVKSSVAEALAVAASGLPGKAVTLVSDPAIAAEVIALSSDIERVFDITLFERLLLAGKLIATSADLELFTGGLQKLVVQRIISREMPVNLSTKRLEAVEAFRRQVQAKVTPRVALERLMVEF